VRDASGTSHRLNVDLDPGDYTLRVRASLGAESYTWEQPIVVTTAGTVEVSLAPPAEAFLHDLAEDYVTGLGVKIVATDQSRVLWIANAPTAFLAWPTGRTNAPVVWDAPTMAVEAPLGVVDAAVRAQVDDGVATRVLPPLYAIRNLSADDTEEE
jgi:hypothetical protein